MADSATAKFRSLAGEATIDPAGAEHALPHHDAHGPHVVPLWFLAAVLGGLLFLTFVTVAVTWLDFDTMTGTSGVNLTVALIVAVMKAALVCLFFMHLAWDSPFNAIALIASMFFVALFIGIAGAGYEPVSEELRARRAGLRRRDGALNDSPLTFLNDERKLVVFVSRPTWSFKSSFQIDDAPTSLRSWLRCSSHAKTILMYADQPYSQPSIPMRAPTPARAQIFGFRVFILSLGVLFFASMLVYVFIRTGFFGPQSPDANDPARTLDQYAASAIPKTSPALGSLELPRSLWISTMLVLAASVTIHFAVKAVRRERLSALNLWVATTLILAVLFVSVQTPAMVHLLSEHYAASRQMNFIYGAIVILVFVHAAHVLGGVIALARVAWQSVHRRYDHEYYLPVRFAATYWHFLDVVWLVMFGTLLILR